MSEHFVSILYTTLLPAGGSVCKEDGRTRLLGNEPVLFVLNAVVVCQAPLFSDTNSRLLRPAA